MRPGSWQHRSALMLGIRLAPLCAAARAKFVASGDPEARRPPGASHVRSVVLVLLNRADCAGVAWPSLPSIARDAEVSRSTASRCIELLVSSGSIVRDGKAGRATRYRVDWVKIGDLCDPPLVVDAPQPEALTRPNAPQPEAHGVSDAPLMARNAPLMAQKRLSYRGANGMNRPLNRKSGRPPTVPEGPAAAALTQTVDADPPGTQYVRVTYTEAVGLIHAQGK